MAGWKKLAYVDEVAILSSDTPEDIGTVASAGTGTEASKDDHVHQLGTGVVDDATLAIAAAVMDVKALGIGKTQLGNDLCTANEGVKQAADQALEVDYLDTCVGIVSNVLAIKDNTIAATQIDDTEEIVFACLLLTPTASGVGVAEGTLFYDSDDNHLYGYVV